MAEKVRYERAVAEPIANELMTLLAPCCERLEIAGSLRRGSPTVGDIELLCIPKPAGNPLFFTDALDESVKAMIASGRLGLRPSIKGVTAYGSQNKLLTHVVSGIGVDIFSTTMENWGMALVVRTGPAVFNIALMGRLRGMGKRGHAYGGITLADGSGISCPTEESVFLEAGWPYIPPERRI